MRTVPLLLGGACFLTLGLRDGSLGVVWPSMQGTFGQPVSALAVLILAGTVGYIAASLSTGALVRRVGSGRVVALGSVLVCVAVSMYAIAPTWTLLIAATVVLIAGAGFVDVGVNAYASHAGTVRHLGVLHSTYGVGTLLGPLLATGVLVAGASWRLVYVVLLAVELPLLVTLLGARARWPPAVDHVEVATGNARASTRRAMWPALIMFFVYVGTEIGVGQWAYTSLTEGRGLATSAAGVAVAGYYGGILAGRLLVAAVGHRAGAVNLIGAGLVVAVAGAAVFTVWAEPVSGCAGLALTGIGLAPVFPALVALAPGDTSGEAAHGVGWRLAAGALGACTLPSAAGPLLQHVALTALGPATLAAVGALLLLHLTLGRVASSTS